MLLLLMLASFSPGASMVDMAYNRALDGFVTVPSATSTLSKTSTKTVTLSRTSFASKLVSPSTTTTKTAWFSRTSTRTSTSSKTSSATPRDTQTTTCLLYTSDAADE